MSEKRSEKEILLSIESKLDRLIGVTVISVEVLSIRRCSPFLSEVHHLIVEVDVVAFDVQENLMSLTEPTYVLLRNVALFLVNLFLLTFIYRPNQLEREQKYKANKTMKPTEVAAGVRLSTSCLVVIEFMSNL